jgi:uncharacterized FlaG/YvyC family protein
MAIGDIHRTSIPPAPATADPGVQEYIRLAHANPGGVSVASVSAHVPTKVSAPELSNEQVRDAAKTIGEALGLINRGVHVTIDESTKQVVTQIVNRDTQEVIRQVPPQEMIDLAKRLRELVGVLFDKEI